MLDKHKLFQDVFAPRDDDVVLFIVDQPHGAIPDDPDWQDRRLMAEEWRTVFTAMPVQEVLPVAYYPATGANNGELPDALIKHVGKATIVIAMTRYSATAPLSRLTRQHPRLRVASMPGVLRRMESTALAADYPEVARRTHLLAERLTAAQRADVEFTTGHHMRFDLRYRTGHADDGLCHPGKTFPLINLPSGEAFIVPYEGERPGVETLTAGFIPMHRNGETFLLLVEHNQIMEISGDGPEAAAFRAYLDVDPARRNIAELGLGCNDQAVVMGAIIEDEKAGMHWAFGRSEHLGGVVGPDSFRALENVVHQDIVYAPASQIGIRTLTLVMEDGRTEEVIRENRYLVF
jgi:leucyl aminopeptidase (aminopeptidase T)